MEIHHGYLLLFYLRRKKRTKRGCRAGLLVRLRKQENRPPLPSILLANVQSIENKLDELRSRIAFQRDIKNCNVIIFHGDLAQLRFPGLRYCSRRIHYISPGPDC